MTARVGVIDYGCGNLKSVANAVIYVGAEPKLVTAPYQINQHSHIILPGVGAFGAASETLRNTGFEEALQQLHAEAQVPILGICLGMQLMCSYSEEGGKYEGFGWFDAQVIPIDVGTSALKVPHMGWNSLSIQRETEFEGLHGLTEKSDVYFLHSYCVNCSDSSDIVATTTHGSEFTSVFSKGIIWGVQFHPEKSQITGLNFLKAFTRIGQD